ncbi:MAG: ArsR family transcriptional regulator [Tagaea sp.]|nr:ArsR family transcriptional regulator [Tagaea sp.]
MSLHEAWREHLRAAILRTLKTAPEYSANDSMLVDVIRFAGFAASRAQIRTEIAWLEEQGLLRAQTFDTLIVATLTERGEDAAAGRATVPGVKRPSAK